MIVAVSRPMFALWLLCSRLSVAHIAMIERRACGGFMPHAPRAGRRSLSSRWWPRSGSCTDRRGTLQAPEHPEQAFRRYDEDDRLPRRDRDAPGAVRATHAACCAPSTAPRWISCPIQSRRYSPCAYIRSPTKALMPRSEASAPRSTRPRLSSQAPICAYLCVLFHRRIPEIRTSVGGALKVPRVSCLYRSYQL